MPLTFVCVNTWTGHVDVLLEEVRLYMSPKVRLLYRPVELVSHSRFPFLESVNLSILMKSYQYVPEIGWMENIFNTYS